MKKIALMATMLIALGFSANSQTIGATNNQQNRRTQETPNTSASGSAIRFSAGFPSPLASVAYNYKISPFVAIGAGVGFGFSGGHETINSYSDASDQSLVLQNTDGYDYLLGGFCMPIFLEFEIRYPKSRCSFFLNLKACYNALRPSDEEISQNWFQVVTVSRYEHYAILASAAVGVGLGNWNFGVGFYSFMPYIGGFVSYDLPL